MQTVRISDDVAFLLRELTEREHISSANLIAQLVKSYRNEITKLDELKEFFEPYRKNMSGFTFSREEANERQFSFRNRTGMNTVHSVNNVPIRFPRERWFHIVENHNDLAGYYDDVLRTVEEPDLVLRGYNASCIAVRGYGQRGYLQVVYRELSKNDGFIITAYFSNKINRKQIIWHP